ncbi:MAG: hypothetical protein AB7V46_08635 [Thermomicrobiales bacterium]
MPIGWLGDGGRVAERPQRRQPAPSWADQVRALAQTVISNATGVESSSRTYIPTLWTRWQTAFDERVCPVCAPYAGRAWPIGEGPVPPLHPHCRCVRTYAFTSWSVRGSG